MLADGSHSNKGEEIPIIIGDGYGYYFYLPFYIIDYNDIDFGRLTSPSEFEPFWNKYQIGEALMILPFFLIGHILTIIFSYPLDGASFFYQHAAGLAGLFYCVAGIYVLKKCLERYYSKKITLIILAAIIFGTNLFHYGTLASLFSHSFSFFLCSMMLFLIPLWFENPKSYKLTIALGTIAGLILLVRLPNILILLFLLLYKVHTAEDIKRRIIFFFRNYKNTLIILLIIIVLFIPQLITWKLTYNQWFVYSYGEAKFHLQQLYISNVLFSLRRGLLFWSPILSFGIIGFWFMRKEKHEYLIPSILLLALITFLNSSFDRWWFGASFGHRGYTEFLPVFAISIGTFYSSLASRRIRISVYIASGILILYSIIQMVLFWKGYIPQDLITLMSYRDFFLKAFSAIKSIF